MLQSLKKPAGFVLSGGLAGLADITVFTLFTAVIFRKTTPLHTLVATILARISSSLINFALNCKVFQGKPRRSIGRYYILWVGQLCCSYGIVALLGHGLGGHLTLVKALGDIGLGALSYRIQKVWVFAEEKGFYGPYARFAKWLFRTFSPRYSCHIPEYNEPVVYVCRHLNMHGPYTIIKSLPVQTHPMILSVFFDRREAKEHLRTFTFGQRLERKPRRHSLCAWVVATVAVPLVHSLQGVPVHRKGLSVSTTMKQGIRCLKKGESLLIFPDIRYTTGYDTYSPVYEGFLSLGQLYYKQTGSQLKFVPLVIDDSSRRILAGEPVTLTDFRTEKDQAAAALSDAINRIPA